MSDADKIRTTLLRALQATGQELAMILKVTEHGLTIPKRLLPGTPEVHVRQEDDRLVIEIPSSALVVPPSK